jgi:hypothetical protein
MKLRLYIQTLLAVAFLILAASCGGGGGGSSSGGGGIGGSGVTGASEGAVEGFGSIFVNGVEFETSEAEFEIEGEVGLEDDLREGMVVKVEGSFDDNGVDGSATQVTYDDDLEGPIDSVTTSAQGLVKTLVVMAQTIIVEDGVTRFDDSDPGFTFASLGAGNIGNVIEVSGFTNFDGSIRATYIEKKADDLLTFLAGGNELEIMGTVSASNFNPPDSFEINGLTIDFTRVTPRNGTLAIGALVEVKGDDLNLAGDTLTATDVEIKPAGLGLDDADKAEVEGFVSNLDTVAKTFEVNGQPVNYSAANFVGGTEAELANGTKVEAEGPISGGVLQAVKIEFRESVRFEANAETVDAVAGTLTLEDLPGITVQVDDLTEFDGVAGLSEISPGNELKIRGRRANETSTTVIASELELIDTASGDRTIIQGPVDDFVAFSSVTIIGVVVDTTTIDDDDFKDDDTIIGEAEFFNRLDVGDLVKARFRDGAWDQIEFED